MAAIDETKELWQSRSHGKRADEEWEERIYLLDSTVGNDAPISSIPNVGDTYTISGVEMQVKDWSVKRKADKKWEIRIRYSTAVERDEPSPVDPDQHYEFEFDLSAITEQTKYAWGETPVVKLAGGGTDLYLPALAYRVSLNENITIARLNIILGLTGRTNNATWLGGAAGEWLFLGANSRKISDTGTYKWRSTYSFLFRDTSVGAWLHKTDMGDDDPTTVLLQKVYLEGNFNTLLLPNPY